jgi:hypothetical protein
MFGKIDVPGNDDKHNFTDPNQGGGPRGGAGTKRIPPAQRGGVGHNGRDIVAQRAKMGGGRSGSGNPASRGGFSGMARGGNFQPDARIPGHGGSAQHRGGAGTGRNFGKNGQSGMPSYGNSNPQPGAGNTSGKSYKLIAGRFKRAAMGAQASQGGSFGSNPVTSNT